MMRMMPPDQQVDPEAENKEAVKKVKENFILFAVSVAIIRAIPFVVDQLS